MPLECSICMRADRTAIDAAIVAGNESIRAMADRWSVSKTTLLRHREHIPSRLVAAHAAAEVVKADTLLDKVLGLEADARRIGAAAERGDDLRTALASVRELVRIVELLGKVSGELASGPAVTVNIGIQTLIQQHGVSEEELRVLLEDRKRWAAMSKLERVAELSAVLEQERRE